MQTLDQFAATRPSSDPLDTIRQYRDSVKLDLLKSGEYSDELANEVDSELFNYAAERQLIDTTDEATARKQFFTPPQNTDIKDAEIIHRQSLDDGDAAAGEAANRYRALLSDSVRQSYADPLEYQAKVDEAKLQFRSLVTPEKLEAARRAAVDRGDLPFARFGDRLDLSPEMKQFAGNDEALARYFEANPELDRSEIPEIRRKLSTPEGFTSPVMEIERQQDFLQAVGTLAKKDALIGQKFSELQNAVDDGSEGNLDPALEQIDSVLGNYGLHNGYTPEERKNFLRDALKFAAAPKVDFDNVDANVRTTSTGQAVVPMAVMMNKPLFDKTMAESKAIPEAQKQALKETREAQISAYAPEAFKVIAANRGEFTRFMQERRDKGATNAQILDEWMANPDNYSDFRSYSGGIGESLVDAVFGIPLGMAAKMGSETALMALTEMQKSDAERRAYAQLFGQNLSVAYDASRLLAPIAADVGVSMLTAGLASGAVAARSSLKAAVKATLGNALRAETKGVLAAFTRGAAERTLARGVEGSSMRGVASVLPVDDVLKLAGADIARKFTQSAVTASYLTTAYQRSSSSTYVQLSTTLADQKNPDGSPKYTPQQVREIALNHGLLAGLSTAVVTGAFSMFGRAGMESIYQGMSKRQLDGVFRRLKADFGKLSPAVTEGLEMESATTMLTSAIKKNAKSMWRELGKDATDEGLEEFTDQIAQGINQAYAEDKKIDVTQIAKEALYAGMLGALMGGGVVAVREGFSSGKVAEMDETATRRTMLLETARNLRNAKATRTADAIERFATQGLPQAPAEGGVPEGEAPAGDVPPSGDAGVAETGEAVAPIEEAAPESRNISARKFQTTEIARRMRSRIPGVGVKPSAPVEVRDEILNADESRTEDTSGGRLPNAPVDAGSTDERTAGNREGDMAEYGESSIPVSSTSPDTGAEQDGQPNVELYLAWGERGRGRIVGSEKATPEQRATWITDEVGKINEQLKDTRSKETQKVTQWGTKNAKSLKSKEVNELLAKRKFLESQMPKFYNPETGEEITYEQSIGGTKTAGGTSQGESTVGGNATRGKRQSRSDTSAKADDRQGSLQNDGRAGSQSAASVEAPAETVAGGSAPSVGDVPSPTPNPAYATALDEVLIYHPDVLTPQDTPSPASPVGRTVTFTTPVPGAPTTGVVESVNPKTGKALVVAGGKRYPNSVITEVAPADSAPTDSAPTELTEEDRAYFQNQVDSMTEFLKTATDSDQIQAAKDIIASAEFMLRDIAPSGQTELDITNTLAAAELDPTPEQSTAANAIALGPVAEAAVMEDDQGAALRAVAKQRFPQIDVDGMSVGDILALGLAEDEVVGTLVAAETGVTREETPEPPFASFNQAVGSDNIDKAISYMGGREVSGSDVGWRNSRKAFIYVNSLFSGAITTEGRFSDQRIRKDRLTQEQSEQLTKLIGESDSLNEFEEALYNATVAGRSSSSTNTASPVTQELASHGDPTTDLPAFLASVAKTGNPEHRGLARLLSLFPAPQVVYAHVPGDPTKPWWAGAYIARSGQVIINTARRGPRGAVDTVLHELIHAATEASILNPNAKQAVVLKRIDAIRRNIQKRAAKAGMDHLKYGLGSNSEFFTHVLTSPQFQRDIESLTPKGEKSFLQVIIEAIKDLLNGRAVKKTDEISGEVIRDMVEFMQSAADQADTSRMGQLLLQPAEVRDISRFYELTEGVTPENVEAWKAENPEKYEELKEMRERVLREQGYTIESVHGTNGDEFTVFDLERGGDKTGADSAAMGIFSTDNLNVAEMYASNMGMGGAMSLAFGNENNPLVKARNEALASPEGKRLSAEWEAAKQNVQDVSQAEFESMKQQARDMIGSAREKLDVDDEMFEKMVDSVAQQQFFDSNAANKNPAILEAYQRETDAENALHAYVRPIIDAAIPNKRVLKLRVKLENPAVYDAQGQTPGNFPLSEKIAAAKREGRDGVIFKNIVDPDESATHYVVFSPEQIKSTEPLNFQDGRLIPPQEWGDSESPDIRFQLSEEYGNGIRKDGSGIYRGSEVGGVQNDTEMSIYPAYAGGSGPNELTASDRLGGYSSGVSRTSAAGSDGAPDARALSHEAGLAALPDAEPDEAARLKQFHDYAMTGNVPHHEIGYYRTNPTALSRLVEYLKAAVRDLWQRVQTAFDPVSAVYLDRLTREMNRARDGYRLRNNSLPFDPDTSESDIRFQLTDDADPTTRPSMADYLTVRDGDQVLNFREGERNPAKQKSGIKNWLINVFGTGSDLTRSMDAIAKAGKDIQSSINFITDGFVKRHRRLSENTEPEVLERIYSLLDHSLGDTRPELTPEKEQLLYDETQQRLAAASEVGKAEIDAARNERDKILRRKGLTAAEKKAAKQAFAVAEADAIDARNEAVAAVLDWERQQKIRYEIEEVEERRRVRDLAQQELDTNYPEWGELSYRMRQSMTDVQSLLMRKYGPSHSLYAKIDRTRGVYLVRAYQIHRDPNFAQKILFDPEWEVKRNAAIGFFEQGLVEQTVEKLKGKVPGWDTMTEDEINRIVEAQRVSDTIKRLKRNGEYADMDDAALEAVARKNIGEQARLMFEDLILGHGVSAKSGFTGNEIRTNVSRFLQKKNIPEELREALGEIKDPFFNALNTYRELASLAHSHFMLENLTAAGIKGGILVSKEQVEADPMKYAGWEPVVSSDSRSRAYAPLARLYADKDNVEAFKAVFHTGGHESRDTATKSANAAMRWLMGAAGFSLGVTTLGSISYYLRNPFGGMIALAAQGHSPFGAETASSIADVKRAAFKTKLTPEQEAHLAKLIALGVVDNGAQIGYTREVLQLSRDNPSGAMAWLEEKLGEKFTAIAEGGKDVTEKLAAAAQLSEEVPLLIEFHKNVKLLERAKWGTPEQIDQEAARRAKMVIFARTETSQGVRAFSQNPVAAIVAPFVRFKAEVWRTFVNTYKLAHQDIKSGNEVLRAEGFKRMASAAAVHGVVTVALPLILQQIAGIGDDEDKALRAAMPGYDKNTSFYFYRWGGRLKSVNLTYLNPYSFSLDPFTSTIRSAMYGRWDDVPEVWTRVITDEIFGENIVAGKVIDVKRNIDPDTGLPISLATDDFHIRMAKNVMHVAESYVPLIAKNAMKAVESSRRVNAEEQPWYYSPSGILLGQFLPTKIRDIDLDDMSYRAFRELQDANRELWQITSKMKSPQGFAVGDVEKTYERMRRANEKIQRDLYAVSQGYKKLLTSTGMNPGKANNTVYQSMVRANFSREKVGAVMQGFGVKRGLTPETIQKVVANDPNVMKAWNEIDRKYAERFRLTD